MTKLFGAYKPIVKILILSRQEETRFTRFKKAKKISSLNTFKCTTIK